MRKQQEKIIKRTKKYGFADAQIDVLSREEFTISELETITRYFWCQEKEKDRNLLAAEAEKWTLFLKQHKNEIKNAKDYAYMHQALLRDSYFEQKDTLLEDKRKIRLFKMYKFLLYRASLNNKKEIDYRVLFAYRDLLYLKMSPWHINILLRTEIENEYDYVSYGWKFKEYPCLLDDYLHNGKNSFLYNLAVERKIISCFYPDSNMLKSLYDEQAHIFFV